MREKRVRENFRNLLPMFRLIAERAEVDKVNIAEKFRMIGEYWTPKIAAEVNDHCVKMVKLRGEFVWHHHEGEDELFLVVRGKLRMQFRGRETTVEEGEFIVVPAGVDHRPVADDEVHVLLVEPKSTLNTGNVRGGRTIDRLDRV